MRTRLLLAFGLVVTCLVTVAASAGVSTGATADATDATNAAGVSCPQVRAAKVRVTGNNVVEFTARVRTSAPEVDTRITLRRASTNRVAFVFREPLEFETRREDQLGYVEELPLDQARQRMVLRMTMRVPGCSPVRVERAFTSRSARTRIPA